jgi:hypothetical protein
MKKLEKVLFEVFKALLICKGKNKGSKIFKELLFFINFE